MIPSGVQVFVALELVDMRWSFDRLAGAALERIGYDARSGALFIYFGKRRDRSLLWRQRRGASLSRLPAHDLMTDNGAHRPRSLNEA